MTLLSKAQTCPLDVQRIIMSCLTPGDAARMALTCRNWLYASRERLYRVILRDGCYGTLKRLDRTLNGSAEIRNFVKFLSIFDWEYHSLLPDWMTLLPAGNVRQVKLLLQNLPDPCVSPVLSLPLMNQIHTLSLKFGLWGRGVRGFMALPNLRRLWLEPQHVSEGQQQQQQLHPVSLSDCRLTINDPVFHSGHINLLRSIAAIVNVTGLLVHSPPYESKAMLADLVTILKSSFTTLLYLAIDFHSYYGPIIDDVLPYLPRLTYLMCGGKLYREGVLPDNLSEFHLYTDDCQVIQGVLCQLEAKKGRLERSSPSSPGLSLRKFRTSYFGRLDHTWMLGLRKRSAELSYSYGYIPIWSIQRDLELEGNWFPHVDG